ncbi:MAG TPA: L,D-transpeptidase family protein [Steroidobacteraceae bacterium]
MSIRDLQRSGVRTSLLLVITLLSSPGCTAAGFPPSQTVQAAAAVIATRQAWTVRLRRADHGARQALQAVYAPAQPLLWISGGQPTPQALALLRILQSAEAYGLEPADYDADALMGLESSLAAADRRSEEAAQPDDGTIAARRFAEFDVSLSAAALKLVSDLHYGRIDPRAAGFELGAPRPDDLDPAAVLRALARSPDLTRALSSVEPQFHHYRLLEQALARYRALATEQVAQQSALAEDVRKIDLTLERWRWLPPFQTPPIIVNIPQFRLFAFQTTEDRAASILQMDVIVGRTFPRMRTPVFAADMKSVIFRPYWDVPHGITVREMLPKIRANPDFLAAEHLEIVQSTRAGTQILPPTEDSLQALTSGAARLRQLPGPDNALGLIKFDLPNFHDVYLHSTPAQQLFRERRRAFSHGCIRVSDPVALAAYVLRDTPGGWTTRKIEAAMHGTESRRVPLSRPIRVMIVYATVLAKEDGEVLFFHDLYGQDRRLEQLLGLAPVPRTGQVLHASSSR